MHNEEDDVEYGSILGIAQKAPEMWKGKIGHEVQKISGKPDVIQALGETGLLPCIVELEMEIRSSGGKAVPYIVNAIPEENTSGEFAKFLEGIKKSITDKLDPTRERILIFSAWEFKKNGGIQGITMEAPEEMSGQYGHPANEYTTEPKIAIALKSAGVPAVADIEMDERRRRGKSAFIISDAKHYAQTTKALEQFIEQIFNGEKAKRGQERNRQGHSETQATAGG
jgi:hypothetical protein